MNPMDMDRYCLMNGCSLREAQAKLKQALAVQEQLRALAERTEFVSAALWCDMGEHSFSSRDRKKVTYKIEAENEDTGQLEEQVMTACGRCAAQRKAAFAPQAMLPAGVDKQEYTAYLEWKNGLGPEPDRAPAT